MPLLWQVVIIVSVVAGIAVLLTVLGLGGRRGGAAGR